MKWYTIKHKYLKQSSCSKAKLVNETFTARNFGISIFLLVHFAEVQNKCVDGIPNYLKILSAKNITASMCTNPTNIRCISLMQILSEFPVNLNMYEIKIETRNKSSVSPFKILI